MLRFHCQAPGCTSSYRHKEHLRRHETKHRAGPHHTCPSCDRVFSRNDSLRRHIRRDHEDPERSTTRATRACTKCRMTKARCQGGSPCTQCQSDGSLCIFDNVAQQASGPAHHDPVHIGSQDPYPANDPVETSFASTARIQHHIQLYFAHFHPHWPILHRQTFSVPDEPPFLLQAVLMIGLWVNGSPQAQQAARDLHSKLGNEILAQRDIWERSPVEENESSDGLTSRWPIATYQGILLYLIFSLSLSVSSLSSLELSLSLGLNRPDREILMALTATCLRNDIFHYPNMITRYGDVEFSTCLWVGVEEIKRLGLALYKVSRICRGDHSLANHDGTVRLLRLSDLQFPMPDSYTLWNAGSNAELIQLRSIYARRGDSLDDLESTTWISQKAKFLETNEDWWIQII
ncbi:unnamed protein product [Penicillium olsonii]|uniref:Uncharacterized protein n=1 Tax=Penicillium olsonii TaxID=99116 RepID=A0A9W4HBA1_PENOL|nr:unnamed protein product [Penicillium olsonii]